MIGQTNPIFFFLLLSIGLIVLYRKFAYVLPQEQKTITVNPKNNGIISYIINMDQAKERYAYVLPNIEKLGFSVERVSGTEGVKIPDDDFAKLVDLEKYKMYNRNYPKKGTVGCSMSHIRTWQKFLESDYEYALIFEDDVFSDSQILKQSILDVVSTSNLWDICLFGIKHNGAPIKVKQLGNYHLVYYLFPVTSSSAYIINKKAAAQLTAKAIPIVVPIDHYFSRIWEFDDIKFAGLEPRIVSQDYGTSNIEATDRLEKGRVPLKYHLCKASFVTMNSFARLGKNLVNAIKYNIVNG